MHFACANPRHSLAKCHPNSGDEIFHFNQPCCSTWPTCSVSHDQEAVSRDLRQPPALHMRLACPVTRLAHTDIFCSSTEYGGGETKSVWHAQPQPSKQTRKRMSQTTAFNPPGALCYRLPHTTLTSPPRNIFYQPSRKQRVSVVTIFASSSSAPQPTPSLPQRLSQAFIEACTPNPRPYSESLREFCKHALEAYTSGYTLSALNLELSSTSGSVQSLQKDEAELRSVWLTLVYKTLRALNISGGGEYDGVLKAPDGMDSFVKSIVSAVRAGYDMKRIQLEQSVGGGEGRSDMESAILGQSTRLVVTTIQAAENLKSDE